MKNEMLTSEFGGELFSLKIEGTERIHQGEECKDEYGNVFWKRHCPVLFPIVGKLKNNKTIINEKVYEMSQHGFARDQKFELVEKSDNIHSYILKSNEYTKTIYPFDFELYNIYCLDKNKLTVKYKVSNTGNSEMPFAIGSHPGFKINEKDLKEEKYYLEFEEDEEEIKFLSLDDGLVKKGYIENLLIEKKRINLNSCTFENDAIIMENIASKKIYLYNKKENKKVLSVNFEQFPYLGVWSKPNAPFVCIEPWFSTADSVETNGAFMEKRNILTLKPKETFECEYIVEFF